ncbi:MAG: DUF1376 domain-containing protein [Aromatoleum sp.]|jgi:uncharacterized protein YdaU (DUF1376 family)|uniref:DUF1376 domain-containing protein n=1 Tax=Aromatoleum sp. TaxID=2307007 RepID=UPI002895279D|nr:DUF1376 domain-containing protein [Aromatoleum sp.]MDT3669916.1 DUF1376 domain-containing protein [Aromatoleum sp.]
MTVKCASANMRRPYRFSIHASDLIADTQHLPPEAFGCYIRLLVSYWRVGPPKDVDEVLARIVGLPVRKWQKLRREVEVFFDVRQGEWLHGQLDEELEAACVAINKNHARTKAATAARKVRTAAHDDVRDVVPNESIPTPSFGAARPAAALAKGKVCSRDDFENDVSMAEGVGDGRNA